MTIAVFVYKRNHDVRSILLSSFGSMNTSIEILISADEIGKLIQMLKNGKELLYIIYNLL